MVPQRIYKTFPFNPSPRMYQDLINRIEQRTCTEINYILSLGSTTDDTRPKTILLHGLALLSDPERQPDPYLSNVGKSFIGAIGDILEGIAPIDAAQLIGQGDNQSGNFVKTMLIHTIENLEKVMAGKSRVQQL